MAVKRSHRTVAEWPLLLLALALVGFICIPLWQWSTADDGATLLTSERIGRMLLGWEQIASYACFVWAGFILGIRYFELRRQQRAFGLDLLPTEEAVRILPEDSRTIQRRVDQLSERGGPFLLSNLIRLALNRFGVSRSPQDASDTVRTQAEVELGRMASSMATVHYLAWAIPALGFVGTVRGIGMALTIVPKVEADGAAMIDTSPLTHSLAVAFDTTLVALLLSLVLMFFLHSVQRDEEALVLDSQQYCLEHLINRLADLPAGPAPAAAEPARTEFTPAQPWPVY